MIGVQCINKHSATTIVMVTLKTDFKEQMNSAKPIIDKYIF